jgi:hypothetical protein
MLFSTERLNRFYPSDYSLLISMMFTYFNAVVILNTIDFTC